MWGDFLSVKEATTRGSRSTQLGGENWISTYIARETGKELFTEMNHILRIDTFSFGDQTWIQKVGRGKFFTQPKSHPSRVCLQRESSKANTHTHIFESGRFKCLLGMNHLLSWNRIFPRERWDYSQGGRGEREKKRIYTLLIESCLLCITNRFSFTLSPSLRKGKKDIILSKLVETPIFS